MSPSSASHGGRSSVGRLYAKSKAPVLIASITADRHITKGTHRPHVPQDLRAVNLAAFEMIDYVLIDANATPDC